MRNQTYGSLLMLAATLVAAEAAAQTPAQAPASTRGFVDFGVRGTSESGDRARYERYRDLGDGLFLETASFAREGKHWFVDLRGEHVGRLDQKFTGFFIMPGQFKGWASWDQIPMLMSNSTRTLFTSSSPSVFVIDDALQAQTQALLSSLPLVFAANSREFETRSRRHLFETGLEYITTPALTFKGLFRRTMREGSIPYGGSFGHSSLVEMPAPVNHDINDVEGGAEYSRGQVLLRGGYTGSWFTNEVTQLAFDSPFRLTDLTTTPGRGRLSLPPSNSYISANGLASVKLPGRSRATAYVSVGMLKDTGEALMAQTINTANTTVPIARTAVDGEARTMSVNLSFVTRPFRNVEFSTKYRTYEYDNRTPEFRLAQRVSYDNAPGIATMNSLGASPSPNVHTEAFGVTRHQFDADARVNLFRNVGAGIGFTQLEEDRSHRVIEANTDNIVRFTLDAVGHSMFSVRLKYEHSERSGEATDEAQRELYRIGEQPGMRHFDVASRDRDRVTILGSFAPMNALSVTASVGLGKDDYTESLFGLRDNRHQVYSLGLDAQASERVTMNAAYTYEEYRALSRSRQASPPSSSAPVSYESFLILSGQTNPGVQIADAARNWATDAFDRAHGADVGFQIAKIAGKLDIGLDYDFSRARANYNYITGAVQDRTLPEEVIVDSVLPVPTQLPPTFSQLHRGTMDAVWAVSPRIGIGLSVWYEQYRVEDFTLDAEANPYLARGSVVLLGYLYKPYTATTVWARLLYRW